MVVFSLSLLSLSLLFLLSFLLFLFLETRCCLLFCCAGYCGCMPFYSLVFFALASFELEHALLDMKWKKVLFVNNQPSSDSVNLFLRFQITRTLLWSGSSAWKRQVGCI